MPIAIEAISIVSNDHRHVLRAVTMNSSIYPVKMAANKSRRSTLTGSKSIHRSSTAFDYSMEGMKKRLKHDGELFNGF